MDTFEKVKRGGFCSDSGKRLVFCVALFTFSGLLSTFIGEKKAVSVF
jgi:hypothetical protein